MSEIGNRHMHFNLDDPHQKTCFDFLKLLKKSSSQFVSDLVCAYLKMQNITDIASLSSKEAKDIAEGVTYNFMSPGSVYVANKQSRIADYDGTG